MKHQFQILKVVPASISGVMANYLDMEHVPIHSGLRDCEIITETDTAAAFVLTSDVGPFTVRNVHYFEYRPPNQILQMVKTPLGPMRVLATAEEFGTDTPDVRTDVTVDVQIDLPKILYPFRAPIEKLLRRLNLVVLEEDLEILERRQKIFGDYVDDYCRSEEIMLFKDAFAAHYSRKSHLRQVKP